MKRRYLILAIGFAAFVGIVLGVLAMLPPRSGVTKANFDRIEDGMTNLAVEEILGSPASPTLAPIPSSGLWRSVFWSRDDGTWICVNFNAQNLVVNKEWIPPSMTFFQRIRLWLSLD